MLVSDAAGAYDTFADENGILDIVLMTSRGEHSTRLPNSKRKRLRGPLQGSAASFQGRCHA